MNNKLLPLRRAGRPGFNYRQGQGWVPFLFAPVSRPALRPTQPPIQRVPGGGGGSYPEVKAAGAW